MAYNPYDPPIGVRSIGCPHPFVEGACLCEAEHEQCDKPVRSLEKAVCWIGGSVLLVGLLAVVA